MSHLFVILMAFLLSMQVQARLLVKVSMVYRNGIDKNLVLESELHSVEEIWEKRPIKLTMKNGTRLQFKAGFWERPVAKIDMIGPSSKIYVEGKLFLANGKLVKKMEKRNSQTEIGEAFLFSLKDKTQLVEVSITPYLE
jgi:hypothetical protein